MENIANKVAIATTTWYNPDKESDLIRANLAKKTIKAATELGYDISVVDGGSSDEFLKDIEQYGAKIYDEEGNSMGAGRRQVLMLAYETGKEIVVWTEPEKDSFIPELTKTALPILSGETDLVIPKRKSLEDYPIFQQYAENMGNLFWKDLTDHNLDVWVGIRTFNRDMTSYFLDYDGKYGDKWDSIFIPIMDLILDGKRTKSVEIDYYHSKEQTEIEKNALQFHRRRLEQLITLITALETHWNSKL